MSSGIWMRTVEFSTIKEISIKGLQNATATVVNIFFLYHFIANLWLITSYSPLFHDKEWKVRKIWNWFSFTQTSSASVISKFLLMRCAFKYNLTVLSFEKQDGWRILRTKVESKFRLQTSCRRTLWTSAQKSNLCHWGKFNGCYFDIYCRSADWSILPEFETLSAS